MPPTHLRGPAVLLALVAHLALVRAARSDFIALDANPNVVSTGPIWQRSVGWAFTANADLTVTKLGFWDLGPGGFGSVHEVGVFDTRGSLLGSATVPAGTAAPIEGRIGPTGAFRFVPVEPISLAAGETYIIAGSNPDPRLPDGIGFAVSSFLVADPGITWVGGRVASGVGPALTFPEEVSPEPGGTSRGIFGPNFQFTTAVPEPSTFALLGLGALVLAGYARRRRAGAMGKGAPPPRHRCSRTNGHRTCASPRIGRTE